MTDSNKAKSDVTENLVTLYLRLNGYFTTGFILHSPQRGAIHTEIDCLAVRFPLNREPERGIDPDPHLCPSANQIDVVLCEVKRKAEPLQFNKALRNDIERLKSVLRWIGLFEESHICKLAHELMRELTPKSIASNSAPEVIIDKRVRVRGVIFSPERNNSGQKRTEPFFVGGDTLFNFAWTCLCPDAPRRNCSTIYDYTRWGQHLEQIVRYFKERGAQSPGTISDLYNFIGLV